MLIKYCKHFRVGVVRGVKKKGDNKMKKRSGDEKKQKIISLSVSYLAISLIGYLSTNVQIRGAGGGGRCGNVENSPDSKTNRIVQKRHATPGYEFISQFVTTTLRRVSNRALLW